MSEVAEATEALKLAFGKIEELTRQYGPQAVDLATHVTQVNAVATLVSSVVNLSLAGALGFAAYKVGRPTAREWQKDILDQSVGGIVGGTLATLMMTVVAVVTGLGALGHITDAWMWVAMGNPKLALAHDVLAKIGVGQ